MRWLSPSVSRPSENSTIRPLEAVGISARAAASACSRFVAVGEREPIERFARLVRNQSPQLRGVFKLRGLTAEDQNA